MASNVIARTAKSRRKTTPALERAQIEKRQKRISADAQAVQNELLRFVQERKIQIADIRGIKEYLKRFPDINLALVMASEAASALIDENTKVSLEVYHDPEIEDHYLTIYVRQFKYDPKIMDIIDSRSQQFEHELAASSGWLILTTDFQPPR